MRLTHTLPLRLRSLLRGAAADRDLDEELRYHLDRQIDELVSRGMTPERARREALLAMGGLDQRKEECRDMRKTRVIEDVVRDLRYAVRTLGRNPGFAAVVILSLALGIGANTAIYSAIDAVMLRMLPVRDPKQLVLLTWTHEGFPKEFAQQIEGVHGLTFPTVAYEAIRDQNDVFDGTLAFAANTPAVNVGLRGRADWAGVKGVSGTYFDTLGVAALYGRTLRPDDDRDSSAPVTMVSHRFWSRALAQDPAAVGTSMIVNGAPVTIVGVVPPEFFGLDASNSIDLFVPLHLYAAQVLATGGAGDLSWTNDPQTWWLSVAGRLKPGVSPAEAAARVNLLYDRYYDELQRRLNAIPSVRSSTLSLAYAVERRTREIGVRIALGAGVAAIQRMILGETLTMVLAGVAVGLPLALAAARLLRARLFELSPYDPVTLLTAVLAVLAVTILAGYVPARRASRVDAMVALRCE